MKQHVVSQLNTLDRDGIAYKVLRRIDDRLFIRFEIEDYHIAATILDPSFKNSRWLEKFIKADENEGNTLMKKKNLLKHFISLFGITEREHHTGTLSNQSSSISLDPVLESRNKMLSSLEDDEDTQDYLQNNSFDEEIDCYFSMTLNRKCFSPPIWWNENAARFPVLKQLFDVFQTIPASSSSSEVAFKSASKFLRQDRAMLSPIKVNKLCFINKNIDLLEKNDLIHTFTKN